MAVVFPFEADLYRSFGMRDVAFVGHPLVDAVNPGKDRAASLRAMEVGAEVILKATKVRGVYDTDPMKNHGAKLFRELTHMEVLSKELKVMDSTAISLCMDNRLPIVVFNVMEQGNIRKVVSGQPIGTLVSM